jgi:hypothetical protein
MTKNTIDLETPYTAEARMTPGEFKLYFIRIQDRLYLDAFGRYWPVPRSPRWPRRLWRWLTRR